MLILILALLDGSTVNLKVDKNAVFDFDTRYGAVKVPLKDIAECKLCAHTDNAEDFVKNVELLGSEHYPSREASTKFLRENKRVAYRFLLDKKDSANQEQKVRVEKLLAQYDSPPPLADKVTLGECVFVGMIRQKNLEGSSDSLGKMSVPLSQIVSIHMRFQGNTFAVKPGAGWISVGFVPRGKLRVTATGEVDTWPQQPGAYVARPDGLQTVFNNYPVGCLMGRINGRQFLLGSFMSTDFFEGGSLELSVNGNPWNSQPTGEFTVTVE